MGGVGSGRHVAPGRRTVDGTPAVDIREWRRTGAIPDGCGLVRVIVGDDVEHVVFVRWHPCAGGGSFPSFICPRCGAGRYRLHTVDGALGCRTCLGLVYQTTRVTHHARLERKLEGLRARLGIPDTEELFTACLATKPPDMASNVFHRLVDELESLELDVAVERLAEGEKRAAAFQAAMRRARLLD